jgi:hypothetical protein
MIRSRTWWYAAGVRALKTVAQTLVGTVPATIVIGSQVDWLGVGLIVANILGSAVLAGVLSLLTSIAGLPEVEKS